MPKVTSNEGKPFAEIGTLLRNLRLRRGLSQFELASAAGINNSYLSRIENGERRPSPKILKRFAEILDYPYDELVVTSGILSEEFVRSTAPRRPVVAERDKLAFLLRREGHLGDVSRPRAAQDEVGEDLRRIDGVLRPVEEERGIDASLITRCVRMHNRVAATGKRRVHPRDELIQHVSILDLADAEDVRAVSPVHQTDDRSQLPDLRVEPLLRPALEIRLHLFRNPFLAIPVILGGEEVLQIPERNEVFRHGSRSSDARQQATWHAALHRISPLDTAS